MIDKLKMVIKREPYLPENSYVHVGFQTQKVGFVWLNLVITFIESRLNLFGTVLWDARQSKVTVK